MASNEDFETFELAMSAAVEDILKAVTGKEESEEAVQQFLQVMLDCEVNPQTVLDCLQREVERVAKEKKH